MVSFPLVTRDKSRRVTAKGMVLEGGWVMQTYLCVASVQGGTVSEQHREEWTLAASAQPYIHDAELDEM